MNPNEIAHASKAARDLNALYNNGSPAAFVLTWIAWEGLKYRVLVLGLVRMGWQVADVKSVLAESDINTYAKYKKVFNSVFGNYPERIKGISKNWQEAESFRKNRNNYVHGSRGSNPKHLLKSADFLISITEDVSWLSKLTVKFDSEVHALGNVYQRQFTKRKGKRSKAQLKTFISNAIEKRK
jgi:hypothetical protein